MGLAPHPLVAADDGHETGGYAQAVENLPRHGAWLVCMDRERDARAAEHGGDARVEVGVVEEVAEVVLAPERHRGLEQVLPGRDGTGDERHRPVPHVAHHLLAGPRREAKLEEGVGHGEVEILAGVHQRSIQIEHGELHGPIPTQSEPSA
jgi:hypothetical protein